MELEFKEWLLNEGKNTFHFTVACQLPPIYIERGRNTEKQGTADDLKALIRDALRYNFTQIDRMGFENAKSRFKFTLLNVSDDRHEVNATMQMEPIPRGRSNKGVEELSDDPYFVKYRGGKTGNATYPSPQDAIKEIPTDPNLAYRGMNWEEWQYIKRTGKIQSNSTYNFSHQRGLTLYGREPKTGMTYAHGFAPTQNQVTWTKPGVIIAISRKGLITGEDEWNNNPKNPRLSSHELAHQGPKPASEIVHAWMLTPATTRKNGTFTIRFPYVASWSNADYKDPRTGIYKLDAQKAEISGSGIGNTVAGCAIRQII
jgi:hypothetical protein